MVKPVSDPRQMIARMDPVRGPGLWAFRTVSDKELTALTDVHAMFREDEGISVLVPAQAGDVAMAQITLQVFSDLEGVGLTAAVSTTLAQANIACNVIAATHHDHVFVPADRCEEALVLLRAEAEMEAAEMSEATATTLIDDARVRVTRFDFAPGDETGWHTHGMDYVITTLTDCNMRLEEPGGETREVFIAAGTVYRRDEGVEHNVINGGDAPMAFIETELK